MAPVDWLLSTYHDGGRWDSCRSQQEVCKSVKLHIYSCSCIVSKSIRIWMQFAFSTTATFTFCQIGVERFGNCHGVVVITVCLQDESADELTRAN